MSKKNNLTPPILTWLATLLVVACCNMAMANNVNQYGWNAHKTCGNPCPSHIDHRVKNDAEFIDALNNAHPGDVIGIDGMINFTPSGDYTVNIDDLTITCAVPSSGIIFKNTISSNSRLLLTGVRNQITHLKIDGQEMTIPISPRGSHFLFEDNEMICGTTIGLWIIRASYSIINNNKFTSPDFTARTCIQLQDASNHSVISNNTIIAKVPSDNSFRGGITLGHFASDLTDVNVKNNLILGDWTNSIITTGNTHSLSRVIIKHNHIEGNFGNGIQIFTGVNAFYNLILRNKIIGGNYGIYTETLNANSRICHNKFLNNSIQNFTTNGVLLVKNSGDNLYIGDATIVDDMGDVSCEGGPGIDHNIIKSYQ